MSTYDRMIQLIQEGKIQNAYTPIRLWPKLKAFNYKAFYVPLNGLVIDGKVMNDDEIFNYIWEF